MLKIAITGGIASGKSEALSAISRLGIKTINADFEVAKMYENVAVKSQISQALGLQNPTKQSVKEVVFKDPPKLKILEKILYKRLRKNFANFERECRKKSFKCCVYEVPLLFEKNMQREYDLILNIETPLFMQRRRFLARKNAVEQDFYKFTSLQFPALKKRYLTAKYNGRTILNIHGKKILANILKTIFDK